ncbi:MAG TPA: hypothetical protein VJN71_11495, partial [Nitrososphaerales archaeon]|nr:hypothetical protein [Nitrososphaerales archaeon]
IIILMEFLEGRALSKHLLEIYSKNPNGWSFTMYPSTKEDSGFFGAVVSGPDEVWRLKLDSIYKPSPLILGTKVDEDPKALKPLGSVPYGYRKIDDNLIRQLLKALEEKEDSSFLDRVLSPVQPVVPEAGSAYAEGPFVLTSRENVGITGNQKDLEDRLSKELRALMRKRFSSYG